MGVWSIPEVAIAVILVTHLLLYPTHHLMTAFEQLVAQSTSTARYDEAFRLVYDELKALARAQLQREYGNHSLTPTALVHEVYMRLLGGSKPDWSSKRHFMRLAARAMRRILVDHARRAKAEKRGGDAPQIAFTEHIGPGHRDTIDLVLDLDRALSSFTSISGRAALVVELRFFAGLTGEEIAQVLDVSRSTVQRDWATAKAWLYRYMEENPSNDPT